jgi:glycine cleavage system aminomethyltransferase T
MEYASYFSKFDALFLHFRTNWNEAVRREHELVSERVGIIDLSPFSKFIVSGKDAR